MIPLLGIILIDKDEFIVKIYQSVEKGRWEVLYWQRYYIVSTKVWQASRVIETVAEAFLSVSNLGIEEWIICSRGVPSKIIKDVSMAINIKIEVLSKSREQELCFNGLLFEWLKPASLK